MISQKPHIWHILQILQKLKILQKWRYQRYCSHRRYCRYRRKKISYTNNDVLRILYTTQFCHTIQVFELFVIVSQTYVSYANKKLSQSKVGSNSIKYFPLFLYFNFLAQDIFKYLSSLLCHKRDFFLSINWLKNTQQNE